MHNDNVSLLKKLSIISESNGSLGIAQCFEHVPFIIKRIFYMFNLPLFAKRGNHAHRKQEQFLICLSGKLKVEIETPKEKTILSLENPSQGIYLPPLTWVTLYTEMPDTICLVLASDSYDESDYIRDYQEFCKKIQDSPKEN